MLEFNRILLVAALLSMTGACVAQQQQSQQGKKPDTKQQPKGPTADQLPPPKPDVLPENEHIVVTQTAPSGTGEARARALLQKMADAIGGPRRMQRNDYRLEGRTSSFFKNQPTGSTEYILYHHPLAGTTYEDRVELTKKRSIVQIWTPTEGFEVTYKGRTELPAADREAYFRRTQYSLDALLATWVADPDALIIDNGTSLVSRRQAESVTIINKNNDSVTVDIEVETNLPIRRTFKVRNATYKDFDEDAEEYSDWHTESGIPVPYATTRYLNGDMVSQRFVTKIEFKPVDLSYFSATAPIGKHK